MRTDNNSQTSSDEQLLNKKASFIQHSLPGLEAGSYEISVQQSLKDSGGNLITTGELATLKRRFGVEGPRYSLPADTVHSVFPPASAAGGFSNSLAHVVLDQEKLPWIRTPYMPGQEPPIKERHYTATYNGNTYPITYDDDKATWMFVLLVTPQDLDGQNPQKQIVQGKASDLVPKSLQMTNPGGSPVTGTLPDNGYSIFSYRLEPGFSGDTEPVDPGVGQTPEEVCNYIDIPAALFNKLAPSLPDLQMLAHVRSVEMDAKPIQDGEKVQPQEQYGLVLGNRLPETLPAVSPEAQTAPAVGANVALLVSLENMQEALRGHSAASYYATNVSGQSNGFVRLIVLYQWSFTSWEDTTFEFEYILKGLNGRDPNAPNNGPKVPNPLLRLPNPPSYPTGTDDQKVVQDMLELGYTPMNHLTRVPAIDDGVTKKIQTVSWYRGPLIPFESEAKITFLSDGDNAPASQEALIFSADQLLRFDPNIGMYDTSYAAAWQLGQLVSLRDKNFSVSLYRWKKGVDQKFRMLLEGEVLKLGYQDLIKLYQDIRNDEGGSDADKPLYKAVIHFLAEGRK
jgi:hypothetical protein